MLIKKQGISASLRYADHIIIPRYRRHIDYKYKTVFAGMVLTDEAEN